ncbi:hypothetical protein ACWKTS_05030 [Bacillus toyonensis]|uniref:Uncharacterized protein n=1 Tax=Bacillus toyonensis TaxID=155322 RepID=A0A2B5UVU1_9BACI|nr:hypothetical protein [Bacillus toyonensis]PEK77405.1 hypothetical protein CN594_27440 [Bacillus toyonensis]PEO41624.1 hypothetical protein CN579_34365 [Bacillus toyonensis]PFY28369.1 hypothetical protein COL54_34880 [Bacillus toyonensis]PFY28876.1 hypothetical protein COL55_33895 [Bacillus toyonensis]PFY61050.1 hypothetical protein COL52_15250 [Bacillus toyonensis]
MYKLYFQFDNGEIVKPYSAIPHFVAVLDWKFQVKEIRTCFSTHVIDLRGGWKFVQSQLDKEKEDWERLPHIKKSFKRYVLKNVVSLLFRNHDIYTQHINENRFIYVKFL